MKYKCSGSDDLKGRRSGVGVVRRKGIIEEPWGSWWRERKRMFRGINYCCCCCCCCCCVMYVDLIMPAWLFSEPASSEST